MTVHKPEGVPRLRMDEMRASRMDETPSDPVISLLADNMRQSPPAAPNPLSSAKIPWTSDKAHLPIEGVENVGKTTALDEISDYLQNALQLVHGVQQAASKNSGSSSVLIFVLVPFGVILVLALAGWLYVRNFWGKSGYKPVPTALTLEEAETIYTRLSKSHEVFSPQRISKEAMVDLLVQHAKITVIPFETATNVRPIYKRNSPSTSCTLILEGKLIIESTAECFKSELGAWRLIGTEALVDPGYIPDFTATVPGPQKFLKVVRNVQNKDASDVPKHTKLLQLDRIYYLTATEGVC